MALTVTKVDVWVAEMEDKSGALATVLEALSEAGADLQGVIARRQPDKPGTGVVFFAPVKGRKQANAASAVGGMPAKNIATLHVEGPNKPGMGARMMRAIAEAGINVRGVSALTMGNKFAAYISFDNAADATKATRVLKAVDQPARATRRRPARAAIR